MPETKVAVKEMKDDRFLQAMLADIATLNPALPGALEAEDEAQLRRLLAAVNEALEEKMDIEPLFFEDIHVFADGVRLNNVFRNEHPEEWLQGEPMPQRLGCRYGVTRLHDEVRMLWDRRHVQDYSRDGNHFPKRILEVMAKLQSAGMPLSFSLTVWTPAQFDQTQPNPDPVLVLELADSACIALCRWNPTV